MKKIYLGILLGVVFMIGILPVVNSALVLGDNVGFVTTAPTADPDQTYQGDMNDFVVSLKDTSPATATKITEIGWWVEINGIIIHNFEVGLYSDDSGTAGNLLEVSRINNLPGNSGNTWINVNVDWDISSETIYWLAVQSNGSGFNDPSIGRALSGGNAEEIAGTTLPNNFEGSSANTRIYAIYAVYETSTSSPLTHISLNGNNHLQLGGGHLELRG